MKAICDESGGLGRGTGAIVNRIGEAVQDAGIGTVGMSDDERAQAATRGTRIPASDRVREQLSVGEKAIGR